jgi:hypothetical protein
MVRGILYEAVVAYLRHCWIRIGSLRQEFELGTSKFVTLVDAVLTSQSFWRHVLERFAGSAL